MLTHRPLALISLLFAAATAMTAAEPKDPFTYLENGIIRIGVDKSRGSAIGYFSLSKDPRNFLNHQDEGRFIQQSYYGDPDGSACSYVAPVRTIQLKNGTVVDYEFYLTIGTLDEIRARFEKIPGIP